MKVLSKLRVTVLSLLGLWLLAATAVGENRVALIMGVWNYEAPGLADLPGIEDDVNRFAARIGQLGFQVMMVKNPTMREAKTAIDEFGEKLKAPDSVGLFYFSGHGGEHEGVNFLIPRKADLQRNSDLDGEAVSTKRLLSRMTESGAKINLVFLDCCRTIIEKTKASERGLAAMQASGVFVGFATASEKEANASQDGSVYTNALLKYIGEPGLSITDMHTQVTGEVGRITGENGATQTPFQYSGLNSLFYMVPGNAAPPPPLDTPPRPEPLPPPPPVMKEETPPSPSSPYLFPDSSERILTRVELGGLGPDHLWEVRNEIYARNGYIFASERGRALVRRLGSAYSGTTSDQTAVSDAFNAAEKANVELIRQMEGGGSPGISPPARIHVSSPWLFPDSSLRRLTMAELSGLDSRQLWRARNEIYARRGYIFTKPEGKALARSLGSAYRPVTGNAAAVEASFSAVENANLNLIRKLE